MTYRLPITNNTTKQFRLYYCALIISLLNWFVLGIHLTPDTFGYTDPVIGLIDHGVFGQILSSGNFAPSAFRTPGTALLLLPIYALTHNETIMMLLGTFLFAMLAPFVSIFAFRLAENISQTAAYIAYVLMLLNANLHFNAVSIMSDLPFAAFFSIANILIMNHLNGSNRSLMSVLGIGLCCGFCALIRPTGLYWLAGVLLVLFLQQPRRRSLKHVFLILGTTALMLAPWVLRNSIVMNTTSLETIKGLALLWPIGDRIDPASADDTQNEKQARLGITRFPQSRFLQYYYNGYDYTLQHEAEVSRILGQISLGYIRTHPREWSMLWYNNFRNIFTSQIHYEEWYRLLKMSPRYQAIQNVGIAITPRFDSKVYHANLELTRINRLCLWLLIPGLLILLWIQPYISILQIWSVVCIAGLTAVVTGYDRFRLPLDPIICSSVGVTLGLMIKYMRTASKYIVKNLNHGRRN